MRHRAGPLVIAHHRYSDLVCEVWPLALEALEGVEGGGAAFQSYIITLKARRPPIPAVCSPRLHGFEDEALHVWMISGRPGSVLPRHRIDPPARGLPNSRRPTSGNRGASQRMLSTGSRSTTRTGRYRRVARRMRRVMRGGGICPEP